MKFKKIFNLAFLFIFISNISFAYNYLQVQDPKNPWRSGTGTIEEATVTIKPCGIYMEYELYLTFSARGLNYVKADTLEVQLRFDLPENAIVHDSWLLINGKMEQSIILDKWTASNIYEEIINRRRDPSILLKYSNNNYELRVFPMAGNETRKVKITYLVPAEWSSKYVTAPLPTGILNTSAYLPSVFKILTWPDAQFLNPQIVEYPAVVFTGKTDSLFGNYLEADLPYSSGIAGLNFTVDAPFTNGVFVGKYDGTEEGYYQMAFLPSKALDITANHKVTVLIDYDASKSTYSKETILNFVKSSMLSTLAPKDSFNVIVSKINVKRISDNWIPADSGSVENTFKNITTDQIADYSNLPSLIADGIDFVKQHGNDGSIVFISCSDQVGDYKVANQLIDDILSLMDPKLPVHVVDFQNINFSNHWFGGRYYSGNDYFYSNITRLTSANYFSLSTQGATPQGIILDAMQSLSGFISSFDLHTKLQGGFCYARYSLYNNTSSIYLNKPILQVGKLQGQLPFIIEASGIFKSTPFSQTVTLDNNQVAQSDSLNIEMWTGNYIKYLEGMNQTNEIINEIIYRSVAERILSTYSAFICLEPGRTAEICYDCLNNQGGLITHIDKDSTKKNDSLSIAAYPNPFNNSTRIVISVPANLNGKNITMKIYNILGQVIKTFDASPFANKNNINLTWDGKNEYGTNVSSGTYLFIVNTGNKIYSTKLVLLK